MRAQNRRRLAERGRKHAVIDRDDSWMHSHRQSEAIRLNLSAVAEMADDGTLPGPVTYSGVYDTVELVQPSASVEQTQVAPKSQNRRNRVRRSQSEPPQDKAQRSV